MGTRGGGYKPETCICQASLYPVHMGTGRDESLCVVWAAGKATAAVRTNAASECVAALATAVKPMGSP